MSPKHQFVAALSVLLSGCAVEASEVGSDTQALASDQNALCRNALSPAEEATVLRLIDNI